MTPSENVASGNHTNTQNIEEDPESGEKERKLREIALRHLMLAKKRS